MLRGALAILATATLAAVGLLTLSLLVFRPTRADYAAWALWGTLFAGHSVAALAWASGRFRGPGIRAVLQIGGVVLVVSGAWLVRETLTSSHFEGYQLVLGALVAVQGAVAIASRTKQGASA